MFTLSDKIEGDREPEATSTHREQLLLPLSIVGVLGCPPFVVYSLALGNYVLGALVLAIWLVFIFNSYALYRKRKAPIPFEILLIPAATSIALSTIHQGIYGTYWCYPLLLFFFFVLSRRMANACGVLLLFIVTFIVQRYVGTEVAPRFALSFGLLLVLANIIVKVMDDLYIRLRRESIIDPLTGAYNRRYMEARLGEAIAQRQRQEILPSVLVMDIDFFKRINDELGHAVGDEVLKNLVKLITERVRQSDKLFRVGGEEFLLFLPETNEQAALALAETIRLMVAEAALLKDRGITISIGVSQLRREETIDDWLKSADEAMYRAKAAGRNRVASRYDEQPVNNET